LQPFVERRITVRATAEIHYHSIAGSKYHPVQRFIFPTIGEDITVYSQP